MLTWIFFKLVDMYTYLKPSYENFKIFKKYEYIDGTSQIHYMYNDKPYVYIGDSFPPTVKPSFSVPIKSAHINGVDVTAWVKRCAGPKNILPDPRYLVYKTRWIMEYEPWWSIKLKRVLVPFDSVVHVENIFNQKSVLKRTLCHLD